MRKTVILIALCLGTSAFSAGCAYRYYLGMHGPSIKRYPDIHQGFSKDGECLDCHHPSPNPQGPVTTHPQFKGCLKCHTDDL